MKRPAHKVAAGKKATSHRAPVAPKSSAPAAPVGAKTRAAKTKAPAAPRVRHQAKPASDAVSRRDTSGGESAESRAQRLEKLKPSDLTLSGVASHTVQISVFAYTLEMAQRIAKRMADMFTGSEVTISPIKRDGATPELATPAPETAAVTPPPAVTPPALPAAGATQPEEKPEEEKPLDPPRGQFKDKETGVIVAVIDSTATAFKLEDVKSGQRWDIPAKLFNTAYEKV